MCYTLCHRGNSTWINTTVFAISAGDGGGDSSNNYGNYYLLTHSVKDQGDKDPFNDDATIAISRADDGRGNTSDDYGND